MTAPPTRSDGRYALRHVDGAGTTHLWTCVPESAHWVARWHAHDSGRPTEVLRDDGAGWQVVSVWTAAGEVPGYEGGWYDDPDDEDYDDDLDDDESDEGLGWHADQAVIDETWGGCTDPPDEPEEVPWRCRPVIDYAAL